MVLMCCCCFFRYFCNNLESEFGPAVTTGDTRPVNRPTTTAAEEVDIVEDPPSLVDPAFPSVSTSERDEMCGHYYQTCPVRPVRVASTGSAPADSCSPDAFNSGWCFPNTTGNDCGCDLGVFRLEIVDTKVLLFQITLSGVSIMVLWWVARPLLG